jgi:glycosyltransferase involved in cell wall biosynthesis
MFFTRKKVHLILNGLTDISFYSKGEARQKITQITNSDLSPTELVVGVIAELTPNKNLQTLIKSFAKSPNWKLVIIGDGEQKPELQNLVKKLNLTDRAILAGFIPEASILLKAFDVFALVSFKEGLPYVLLEAGLAGIPVIGSDIPGIEAIISSPDEGILLTPSEEKIAEALNTLKNKPDLRQELGSNLQSKIKNKFNFSNTLNSTIEIYNFTSDR